MKYDRDQRHGTLCFPGARKEPFRRVFTVGHQHTQQGNVADFQVKLWKYGILPIEPTIGCPPSYKLVYNPI